LQPQREPVARGFRLGAHDGDASGTAKPTEKNGERAFHFGQFGGRLRESGARRGAADQPMPAPADDFFQFEQRKKIGHCLGLPDQPSVARAISINPFLTSGSSVSDSIMAARTASSARIPAAMSVAQ
jgi:hypothetical protein